MDISIALEGTINPDDAVKYLISKPHIQLTKPRDKFVIQSLIFQDGHHVIEISISTYTVTEVDFSIALCNPPTVDDVLSNLAITAATELHMTLTIKGDVPDEGYEFNPDRAHMADKWIRMAIAKEREYWIKDFGTETAALTINDAIQRFVLPHCKPPTSHAT